MGTIDVNYDELEQYAYPDSEHIEKAADGYSSPIGLFLIKKSSREVYNYCTKILIRQLTDFIFCSFLNLSNANWISRSIRSG